MNSNKRAGYSIIVASCLIQGVAIGGMFAYGVLFSELVTTFGWSRATVAGAISMATLVMGTTAMLMGRLNDRFGPRGVLTMSAISYGSGYLLMSFLSAPWQLFVFWGLMIGVGLSTHDVITLSTVARWFPRRRGLVSGIVKAGTGCGQLLIPALMAVLVATYGWRTACQIFGVGAFLVLISAAQVMRRDPVVTPASSSPASGSVAPPAGARTSGNHPAPDMNYRTAMRTPTLWLLCGSQFLVFSCLMTITVHLVPHGIDLGLSRGTAAALLSTIGGISLLGRLTVGGTIDRIGGRRALMGAYCMLLIALIWLQFAHTAWMLFAFAAMYGVAHGGFFTAMSPTVAELFGTRAHGALFGTVLFCGSMGGALGPVAAGASFDALGSYQIAFGVLCFLAATGFVLVSRLALHRPA